MIRALIWKEWREIWQVLPVGILWAVGLVVSSQALGVRELPSLSAVGNRTDAAAHGSPAAREEALNAARFRRSRVRWMVGLSAAMVLGIAALVGAGAFAQEREGKTDIYLESLAASRQLLWGGKLLARALALVFAVACAGGPILLFALEAALRWEVFGAPGLYVVAFSALGVSLLTSTLLTDSLGALAAGLVLWLTPFVLVARTFPKQNWDGLLHWRSTLIGHSALGACALALSLVVFVYRPFQGRGGSQSGG